MISKSVTKGLNSNQQKFREFFTVVKKISSPRASTYNSSSQFLSNLLAVILQSALEMAYMGKLDYIEPLVWCASTLQNFSSQPSCRLQNQVSTFSDEPKGWNNLKGQKERKLYKNYKRNHIHVWKLQYSETTFTCFVS